MNKAKNNNQDNNRNFDDILNHLGNIGRYQWEIYILSILPVFIAGMLSTSFIFTTATPDYRCLVETCDSKTITTNGTEHQIFNEEFLQYTTPLKNNPGKSFQFDRCHKYSIINDYNSSSINGTDNGTLNSCLAERFDINKIIACDNYLFDKQYFHSTIVTEFNLWCNDEWLVQIVQMLFFFGVLVGAIVNGILADKFGRKIIFQIYSPVTCLAILVCTLSFKWYFYAIGLYLKGMCVAAIYQSSFTIGIECLGGSWRFWMGNSYAVIFAAGGIYASLMADWLRDWHYIEMTNLIPAVLMLPYPFILCESIRWQFSSGQTSNALQQIALAAQKNGIEIPDKILKEFMTLNDKVKVKSDVSIKDLFTHQLIRTWTITFLYIWFTNSLVYYGFSFLAGDINPNIYLSMILLMAVEFPGTFLAAYLGEFGRKIVLIGTMILCGAACIIGSFADGPIKMWLSVLGKMAISGSFALIYIYVAEIFPTVLRITGIGMCSFCARIGAMIAPYIFKLNIFGDSVPFLAIGIISFLAGLSGFLLPETKGKKLPNTLDEVEQLKYSSNTRHNDYQTMSDEQSKQTDNIM